MLHWIQMVHDSGADNEWVGRLSLRLNGRRGHRRLGPLKMDAGHLRPAAIFNFYNACLRLSSVALFRSCSRR